MRRRRGKRTIRVDGRDLPKPRKKARPPCWRPEPPVGWQGVVLNEMLFRPFVVPPTAVCLHAFVDIPGDNEQRTAFWTKNEPWKEQLKADFVASLAAQKHPGLIQKPQVFIRAAVGGKSDPTDLSGRYKRPIDLLQLETVSKDGKHFGCLGLIENDRHLVIPHEHYEERVVKRLNEDGEVARSITIWVWGEGWQ